MSQFVERMRRVVVLSVLTVGIGTAGTCPDAPAISSPVPVASVRMGSGTLALTVGQAVQLTATAADVSGATLTGREMAAWSSSDQRVATVGASGIVTAVAQGQAVVRATIEGVTGERPVSVSPVPVSRLELLPNSMTVAWTKRDQFVLRMYDASGKLVTGQSALWSSSSTAVTVDSTGAVTGVVPGSSTVTARVDNQSASAYVSVTNPCWNAIVVPSQVTLPAGSWMALGAAFTGSDGKPVTPPVLEWWSTDTTVAQVRSDGYVQARRSGYAYVYAGCGSVRSYAYVRVP